MSKNFEYILRCIACDSENLEQILDLWEQPLANSYHKGETLPKYPLALNVCKTCYHGQLSVSVNPDELFKHYLYVSGTSQTLKNYFKWFTEKVHEDYLVKLHRAGTTNVKKPVVLDIACNDGSQLDEFKKLGWKTYGVDPAENLAPIAKAKGHEIICDYWSLKNVDKFNLPKVDVIIAQNVFAHVNNPLEFLLACQKVMHPKTVIYIQTSQANMILNGEFDTIYHEHLSFFNTNSMWELVKRSDLLLDHVSKTPIHGTSYLFEITWKDNRDLASKFNVDLKYEKEKKNKLYDIETYHEFANKAKQCIIELKQKVEYYKQLCVPIIGAGVSAKSMTLLNYGRIYLDFMIDENPLKQGLHTPGTNIPIYAFDEIKKLNNDKIVVVITAWNFAEEIKQKIKALRPDKTDVFITYFPILDVKR